MRPGDAAHDPLVEAAKPFQLQQLRPCQIENEGGDAEAHHLGQREHPDGAEPVAVRQHPQTEDFQRQQQQDRHDKDHERRRRRQALDPGRKPRLDRAQGNARHGPSDDRREVVPQPRLEQEDEGEQNPERAEKAAHI
jgi:hypothetical protein